jgi:hypothetical protein
MRLFAVLVASGVAALLVPGLAARAQGRPGEVLSTSAPVVISACRGGITSIELVEIASYDVTLRNTTPLPADEIRLSARYGRHEKRATFDLKEPFLPGVEVTKHVRRTVSGGLFAYRSDQNDCFVDYVHFTNGSSWSRPAATR